MAVHFSICFGDGIRQLAGRSLMAELEHKENKNRVRRGEIFDPAQAFALARPAFRGEVDLAWVKCVGDVEAPGSSVFLMADVS